MGDGWQLEAVHEQFKSLAKRKELHLYSSDLNSADKNSAKTEVRIWNFFDSVLFDHLKLPRALLLNISHPNIVSQISKAAKSDSNIKTVTLSFIVIVTNKEGSSGGLCKIPIFLVEAGKNVSYIDINGSLYNSWKVFLKVNDLPPTYEFCYPVDGKYSNAGKLKINYAKSPASKICSGGNLFLQTPVHEVVCAGSIASTFLFKVGRCVLHCAKVLIPIVKKLIPVLLRCANVIGVILLKVQKSKNGDLSIITAFRDVFHLLNENYESISEEVSHLWKEIKLSLDNASSYVSKEFGFDELPASECCAHTVLASTYKIDSELKQIKKNADTRVQESAVNKGFQIFSSKKDDHTQTNLLMSPNPLVQSILMKSKRDYENSRIGEKELIEETHDTVSIAANIVKHIQASQSESIHVETLETLSETFKNSFKEEVDRYIKMVKAAEKGAGHKIDLEAFNKELDIDGDFKVYFWKKCLLKHGPKLGEEIKMKLKKVQSKNRIMMHEITNPEHSESLTNGRLFLWKSNKQIRERDILCALEEEIGLQIKDLVINNLSYNIVIRSEDYNIFVHQTDHNSNEGLMLIHKS